MQRVRVLSVVGILALVAWLAGGCSNVDQLADPNPAFETLVVAYGDPGRTPIPCDDYLPVLDGVAQNVEWDFAEPLFVRMSGENGNGGGEYFLEVRAIWTDEARLGSGGTNRIYFLVRYPDNDQDLRPDQLAYIYTPGVGDPGCDEPFMAEGSVYCPSPIPRVKGVDYATDECDSLLFYNRYWTKLNQGGREDQVFVMITQAADAAEVTTLIDLNRKVLGTLGPQIAGPTNVGAAGTNPTELWAWRAGRTNLHPVPQFADWSLMTQDQPVPPPSDSRFIFNCGFCEDLWVNGGSMQSDAGLSPFVRNFGTTFPEGGSVRPVVGGEVLDTVPVLLTECPQAGRETEEDLAALNGGLPKDLALWRHGARFMNMCRDSLACSRTGADPPKWSTRLLSGEFDYVQGWALRVPSQPPSSGNPQGGPTSGRDVRARAVFEAGQEKGFTVWSLEIMRNLNTGQPDDLVIDPNSSGEYRMVIGVLDASGRVGSGSTEIRLKFQAPNPNPTDVARC